MMNRRQFTQWIGAGALGFALPRLGWGHDDEMPTVPGNTGANGRVVVIGGGMGGATAAKYLRLWGGSGVQVTLIERNSNYQACILSNLILNGSRSLSNQTFTYDRLRQYGVNVVRGEVTTVDTGNHVVRLASGTVFPYDKVILSPGIDFDPVPITGSPTKILHAWQGGPQIVALRDQIRAMPAGGLFAITIPLAPFRASTAPYDRACVVADWLKRNRPGATVLVLDANPVIQGARTTFTNAFQVTHAGVIDYRPGVTLNNINADAMTLDTSIGTFQANVINAIPRQKAARIIIDTGLNKNPDPTIPPGRFALVNVLTYESRVAQDIHVLGDSASLAPQPKGGTSANMQAKVCADAIIRLLHKPTPLTVNPSPVTSAHSFAPITASRAAWVSGVFAFNAATNNMAVVGGALTESASPSIGHFEDMNGWFSNLMSDTFG
jgi:sulfide dehydrogenase [flavocytochrome c] flavoprotein subunit